MIGAILQGLSLAGGLAGALRKPKTPDVNYMQKHFGEGALADRASALAQKLMSSAYGQQLIGGAAETGQQMANSMAARAAQSGFGASEGAESGASTFATGAASGAANSMMNQAKTGILGEATQQAATALNNERQQYIEGVQAANERPNAWQQIGNVAGQAASLYGKMQKTDNKTDGKTDGKTPPTAKTGGWGNVFKAGARRVGKFFGFGG